jgi:hypothetical protein
MILRLSLAVVLILLAGAAGIVLWGDRLEVSSVRGAILGAVLAAAGSIGGTIPVARSLRRGASGFLQAVVLGILGRMTLFVGALLLVGLFRPAGCSLTAVALSLLGFFFVFQVLEVRFVIQGSRRVHA